MQIDCPAQPSARTARPSSVKPLNVREALAFKAELRNSACSDLLIDLLRNVNIEGGESSPDWQRYKLRLRALLDFLGAAEVLDLQEVETIYWDLVG